MPDDERDLLPEDEALAVAEEALERRRTEEIGLETAVDAALRDRGYRYDNTTIISKPTGRFEDDPRQLAVEVRRFARRL